MIICQWSNRVISWKLLSIIDIGENIICLFVSVICFCSRKYFYLLFNSDWNIHSVCITHWVHSARGERNVKSFPKCLPLAICPSFNAFKTIKKIFNYFFMNPIAVPQNLSQIIVYFIHLRWLEIHLFFLCLCSQVVVHILGDLCSLGKRQNPTFIQNILGSKVFCHFHSASGYSSFWRAQIKRFFLLINMQYASFF